MLQERSLAKATLVARHRTRLPIQVAQADSPSHNNSERAEGLRSHQIGGTHCRHWILEDAERASSLKAFEEVFCDLKKLVTTCLGDSFSQQAAVLAIMGVHDGGV